MEWACADRKGEMERGNGVGWEWVMEDGRRTGGVVG